MTTSGTDHSDALEGRGYGAAVVAAVIGLIPAIILGSLRFFLIDEPRDSEQFAGNVAFGLTYVAPYLLVLMASKVRSPAARGALLAVLGLLSLAASFSGLLSLFSLVLLPATFAIWFAAARSLTASVHPLATTTFAMIAGILIATMVGLSFLALLVVQDPEPQCWVLSLSTDGEYVWKARPDLVDQGEVQTITLSGPDIRSSCVSDIITNTEAGVSLGLLATAFLAMILTMRHGSIRAPDNGRA